MDTEAGIHVSVVPAQSAFYAGEPFVVTVTFTNTNSPTNVPSSSSGDAGPARMRRTSSQTHRRGVHSISSAPLSRPPTSPITPRTAGPSVPLFVKQKAAGAKSQERQRKGLIGLGPPTGGGVEGYAVHDRLSALKEQRAKRFHSVDLSNDPLRLDVLDNVSSPPSPYDSPPSASMSTPSPRQRDPLLVLAANHPHARKPSVIEGIPTWLPHPPAPTRADEQQQLQLQLQLQNMSFTPPPISTPSVAQSASGSTFSLSLDTIAEGTGPTSPGAFSPGAATTPSRAAIDLSEDSHSHSYPPRPSAHARRQAQGLGLGYGPPPSVSSVQRQQTGPHTAPPSSSSFARSQLLAAGAGSELILYSYAQIAGSLTLSDPPPTGGAVGSNANDVRAINAVRAALLRGQKKVVGGGRMDISSSLALTGASAHGSRPASRRANSSQHSRAASLGSSLMSLLSPASLLSTSSSGTPSSSSQETSSPKSPGHRARFPSTSSGSLVPSFITSSVSSPARMMSSEGSNVGLGLRLDHDVDESIDPEMPFPIFEPPPSMLAVDAVLAPGESRSYEYSIELPAHLPPTYKGRVLKFAYQLVVGVCRSASPLPQNSPKAHNNNNNIDGNASASTSRVMRVPIRVYNYVSGSGTRPCYNLLLPLLRPAAAAASAKVSENSLRKTLSMGELVHGRGRADEARRRNSPESGGVVREGEGTNVNVLEDLRGYALRLLASAVPSSALGERDEDEGRSQIAGENSKSGGELSGCREAVEILTRTMRKVSYDVTKDGVIVAVLTFTKSAYRLGETIIGIVELNERASRARVLKLSALLEAHESLPSNVTAAGGGGGGKKKLRRVHAEAHFALTACALRTTFALEIPADAAPTFLCECDPSSSPFGRGDGGLEWKVRLCLLVSVASAHARAGYEGIRVKHLVADGGAEGRGQWGSSWRATRGIAPLQNIDARRAEAASQLAGRRDGGGWASYLFGGLLGSGEREYHDGDEEVDSGDEREGEGGGEGGVVVVDEGTGEVDVGGGERGWSELRVETVECEVPVGVWPGNTAFRPGEVAFSV